MTLFVIDPADNAMLGQIEPESLDFDILLDELEESDYIDGGDDFSVKSGPDGCFYIYENNTRCLILDPTDPEDEDEDDEDDLDEGD